MCRKVVCDKCKKWTWTGCGQHIQQALMNIPQDQICKCKK
jgi:hypothetical protein